MYQPSGQVVAARGHHHLVQFYESEDFLAASVADFIAPGLRDGGPAVIVATEDHRIRFLAALQDAGAPVAAAIAEQRLVALDAAATLGGFMTESGPAPGAFHATVSGAIDRAEAGAAADAPTIRIYGEMVALLWAEGRPAWALELEELWTRLSLERAFELLCAYPLSGFDGPSDSGAFARVCSHHNGVIPGDRYSALAEGDHDGRRRVVAGLQQEVLALRSRLELAHQDRCVAAAPPRDMPAADEALSPQSMLALAEGLCAALRASDARRATQVLKRALDDGVAAAALSAGVVPLAMNMVGTAWARGEISDGDGRMASATCEQVLAWLYPFLLTHRPRSRERVVVATVPGDSHRLASRSFADVLEGRGYDVVHVSDARSPAALGASVELQSPALVALSATVVPGAELVHGAIAAVQAVAPDVLILLGGQGVDDRWARAGFPVADDARSGARAVERLLRERPPMPPVPTCAAHHRPAPSAGDALDRLAGAAAELGLLAREHALLAREFRLLALEDPLTGLPNRRAFELELARMLAGVRPASVMLVDIDHFKRVNDTRGHAAGDQLLITVASALVAQLSGTDTVARLGGDEFGVLTPLRIDRAAELAGRLRMDIERRFWERGTTVSIGVAACPGDRIALLRRADEALYAAKRRGRNTVCRADLG